MKSATVCYCVRYDFFHQTFANLNTAAVALAAAGRHVGRPGGNEKPLHALPLYVNQELPAMGGHPTVPVLTESWMCHQSLTIDHRTGRPSDVSAMFDWIISSIWESGWAFVFSFHASVELEQRCCSLLSREKIRFPLLTFDKRESRIPRMNETWSIRSTVSHEWMHDLVYSAVVCSIPARTPSHSACLCLYTVCVREGDSPVNAGPTTPW